MPSYMPSYTVKKTFEEIKNGTGTLQHLENVMG